MHVVKTTESLPNLNTGVIKTVYYWYNDSCIDQGTHWRVQKTNKQTPLHIYGEWICDKGAMWFQLEKKSFFNKCCEIIGWSYLYFSF